MSLLTCIVWPYWIYEGRFWYQGGYRIEFCEKGPGAVPILDRDCSSQPLNGLTAAQSWAHNWQHRCDTWSIKGKIIVQQLWERNELNRRETVLQLQGQLRRGRRCSSHQSRSFSAACGKTIASRTMWLWNAFFLKHLYLFQPEAYFYLPTGINNLGWNLNLFWYIS